MPQRSFDLKAKGQSDDTVQAAALARTNVLAGIELVHMIRKCQFAVSSAGTSVADQFYAVAGQSAQYEPEPRSARQNPSHAQQCVYNEVP